MSQEAWLSVQNVDSMVALFFAKGPGSHEQFVGVSGILWAKWLQSKVEGVANEQSLCQICVVFLYIKGDKQINFADLKMNRTDRKDYQKKN